MALLYISTGALNSTNAEFSTVSGAVSISTSTTRPNSDAHSLRVNAGSGFIRSDLFTSNQATVGYIGIALYISSAMNASTQLLRFSNASNVSQGNITLTSSNTLTLIKVNGTQIGSASAALSLNTWYYIELKNDASGAGALEGRINGSVFATGANSAAGTWARGLVGAVTGTQTTNDIFITDIKMTDSSGSSFNSYPGSGNVLIVRPSGAGDSTQWSIAGSSPAATNWQSVSETTPDDAVTLVNESLLNLEDLYAVGSSGIHSYDTVNAVAVGVRFNNNTADAITSFQVELEKASGGTKQLSASMVPNSITWITNKPSGMGISYPLVAYTDPDGAPWTSSTLGTMQIGVIAGTVGINKVQLTNIWAYVEYVPGTAPTTNGNFLSFM